MPHEDCARRETHTRNFESGTVFWRRIHRHPFRDQVVPPKPVLHLDVLSLHTKSLDVLA